MATKPTGTGKKPGRKAETLQERMERQRRDLKATEAAFREQQRSREAIVGNAVIEEGKSDPAFMDAIRRILRKRVTGKASRELVAALFELDAITPGKAAEAGDASASAAKAA